MNIQMEGGGQGWRDVSWVTLLPIKKKKMENNCTLWTVVCVYNFCGILWLISGFENWLTFFCFVHLADDFKYLHIIILYFWKSWCLTYNTYLYLQVAIKMCIVVLHNALVDINT